MDKPKVGQMVRWESQSGGVSVVKQGEVIYSGDRPWFSLLPVEVKDAGESRLKFDAGQDGRFGSGLIVKVPRESGRGFEYYSPRITRRLEVIE